MVNVALTATTTAISGVSTLIAIIGLTQASGDNCDDAPSISASERIGLRYLLAYVATILLSSVAALVAFMTYPQQRDKIRNVIVVILFFFLSFWFTQSLLTGFTCGNGYAIALSVLSWIMFAVLVVGTYFGFAQDVDSDDASTESTERLVPTRAMPQTTAGYRTPIQRRTGMSYNGM